MTEEKLLPLHQAILDDDLDTFKKLLDKTDDIKTLINEKDDKGRNAIFYAARSGSLDRVRCMLSFGASPDFVDPQTGDSLLHVALLSGIKPLNVGEDEYVKQLIKMRHPMERDISTWDDEDARSVFNNPNYPYSMEQQNKVNQYINYRNRIKNNY